jgi:5-methylthioribose kinase
MLFEINALKKYASLAQQYVPRLYHVNEDMSLVAMHYYQEHSTLRSGMLKSKYFPFFAEHMADFLATVLFKTSVLYLRSPEKRKLNELHNKNSELCLLSEDLVFTFPYRPQRYNYTEPSIHGTILDVWNDDDFQVQMLQLKDIFMNRADALIHSDLHAGSFLINERETIVIDMEFSFMGPMGFDVGCILADLTMFWVAHFERSHDEVYQTWIIETMREFMTKFFKKFRLLWQGHSQSALTPERTSDKTRQIFQEKYLLQLLRESVGFAGAEMTRRQIGVGGVEEIREIKEPEKRARAIKHAVAIGVELVKRYHLINSIDELIDLILNTKRSHVTFSS